MLYYINDNNFTGLTDSIALPNLLKGGTLKELQRFPIKEQAYNFISKKIKATMSPAFNRKRLSVIHKYYTSTLVAMTYLSGTGTGNPYVTSIASINGKYDFGLSHQKSYKRAHFHRLASLIDLAIKNKMKDIVYYTNDYNFITYISRECNTKNAFSEFKSQPYVNKVINYLQTNAIYFVPLEPVYHMKDIELLSAMSHYLWNEYAIKTKQLYLANMNYSNITAPVINALLSVYHSPYILLTSKTYGLYPHDKGYKVTLKGENINIASFIKSNLNNTSTSTQDNIAVESKTGEVRVEDKRAKDETTENETIENELIKEQVPKSKESKIEETLEETKNEEIEEEAKEDVEREEEKEEEKEKEEEDEKEIKEEEIKEDEEEIKEDEMKEDEAKLDSTNNSTVLLSTLESLLDNQ